MSSGMNIQEAENVAEKMTYREAVINCLNAKCVPYRKATKIKMKQLLESIDNDFTDDLLNMGSTKGYQQGRADRDREIAESNVFFSNKPIEDIVLEARADERERIIEELKQSIDNGIIAIDRGSEELFKIVRGGIV